MSSPERLAQLHRSCLKIQYRQIALSQSTYVIGLQGGFDGKIHTRYVRDLRNGRLSEADQPAKTFLSRLEHKAVSSTRPFVPKGKQCLAQFGLFWVPIAGSYFGRDEHLITVLLNMGQAYPYAIDCYARLQY